MLRFTLSRASAASRALQLRTVQGVSSYGLNTVLSQSPFSTGSKQNKKLKRANSMKGIKSAKYNEVTKQSKKGSATDAGIAQAGGGNDLKAAIAAANQNVSESQGMEDGFVSMSDFKMTPAPATTSARMDSDPTESLYTMTYRVSEHQKQDIGRYYQLADGIKSQIPTALTNRHVYEEINDSGGYLCVRPVMHETIARFNPEHKDSLAGKSTAVVGRVGTGKSVLLHYAAQYALENQWILLSTNGLEFPYEKLGFIKPTAEPSRENLEDLIWHQPNYTQAWFKELISVNEVPFKRVTLKNQYGELFGEEGQSANATLYDLVHVGAENIDSSVAVLDAFVAEIQQVTAEEPTVLTVVDDYNRWDEQSEFYEPIKVQRIPARQLGLVQAFDALIKQPPATGVSLFAPTSTGLLRHMQYHVAAADETVETAKYTDGELHSAVFHYTISSLISYDTIPEGIDKNFIGRVKMMTGSCPKEVYEFAMLL